MARFAPSLWLVLRLEGPTLSWCASEAQQEDGPERAGRAAFIDERAEWQETATAYSAPLSTSCALLVAA